MHLNFMPCGSSFLVIWKVLDSLPAFVVLYELKNA